MFYFSLSYTYFFQFFRELQGLDEGERISFLRKAQGTSIDSTVKAISSYKYLKMAKGLFAALTDCNSWEEAEANFPDQANENALLAFKGTIKAYFLK